MVAVAMNKGFKNMRGGGGLNLCTAAQYIY